MRRPTEAEGVVVSGVRPRTAAAAAGLVAGDRILAINGHALRDAIDFQFYAGEERLCLDVERAGRVAALTLSRSGGDLGVELQPPTPGEISTCANKCVFCFIHQLPKGMRKSLYVKDDDFRLSFLHGNYITLTDLDEAAFERIVEQRLSPLYISVHATDPDLRHRLLGQPLRLASRPDAARLAHPPAFHRSLRDAAPPAVAPLAPPGAAVEILPRMERLAKAGIRMHAQIVLCPDWNDGPHLERTVRELAPLHPHVSTTAIVPVGLTRHRERLPALRGLTPAEARGLVATVEGWQARYRAELGGRFVFLADEIYLLAGHPIPPAVAYEGFPIVEDGVGLVRRFEDGFARALRRARPPTRRRVVTMVTGEMFAPRLERLLGLDAGRATVARVAGVPNDFFGRSIGVAGLLTGRDILRELSRRDDLGEAVLLPAVAVRDADGVLLDDAAPADLARDLGVPVRVVPSSPGALLRALDAP